MRSIQLLFSLALLVFVTTAGAQTDAASSASANQTESLAKSLGVSFPQNSRSTLVLERDGKKYVINVSAQTIQEMPQTASAPETGRPANGQFAGAAAFRQNCAVCHGPNGAGNPGIGTPNFHDASLQRSLSDQQMTQIIANGKGRMPAWSGKLNDTQIADLVTYIRSFAPARRRREEASRAAHRPLSNRRNPAFMRLATMYSLLFPAAAPQPVTASM